MPSSPFSLVGHLSGWLLLCFVQPTYFCPNPSLTIAPASIDVIAVATRSSFNPSKLESMPVIAHADHRKTTLSREEDRRSWIMERPLSVERRVRGHESNRLFALWKKEENRVEGEERLQIALWKPLKSREKKWKSSALSAWDPLLKGNDKLAATENRKTSRAARPNLNFKWIMHYF